MSERANVKSVQALLDMKAALIDFQITARAALMSVDTDISRTTQWLQSDRPSYWKREIRRREDVVNQCRLEIQRKRLIAAPEPASTVFEERQLRRATARLDSARARLQAVQRWGPVWEKEAGNSKALMRGLSDSIGSDIPRAVAQLERMINALEEYAAIRAPRADDSGTVEAEPAPDDEPRPEVTP